MTQNPTAEIKDLIMNAFAEEMKQTISLSHSDFVELRQDLISLRDEDIKSLLPFVLIDLLETHTNDYWKIENGDAVVRLLTPVEPIEDAHPNVPGLTKAEEEYMAREQNGLFSIFSASQAASIARWLEAAKGWEDLCFCRDQIEIANRYWSQKASST
jgi:hypothetical protein